MKMYVFVFNGKPKKYMFDKSDRKKIAFPPTFTKKLFVSPANFSTSSCIDELKKFHELVDINTVDLIFFPVIIQRHWVLICLNVLYKKLNFLESVKLTSEDDIQRIFRNLATNFSSTCSEANIFPTSIQLFQYCLPCNYPYEHTVNETRRGISLDCGFYCILYMDCWDGLKMRDFDETVVQDYRKIISYKIYYSSMNKNRPINATSLRHTSPRTKK
ncbi:hypothetical protein BS78_09G046400 [Paspalum vaginatum]|nr:hypothetical protein BS78_09G046400 [Paspalum vaginatum]